MVIAHTKLKGYALLDEVSSKRPKLVEWKRLLNAGYTIPAALSHYKVAIFPIKRMAREAADLFPKGMPIKVVRVDLSYKVDPNDLRQGSKGNFATFAGKKKATRKK